MEKDTDKSTEYDKEKVNYHGSHLIYNHVSQKYSKPQPAVCLPGGTDFLELCKNKILNA